MRIGDYVLHPTRVSLAIVAASAAFVHLRGRARLNFARQLTDHSTFTAPYNALVYLASRVPATPFLDPALFDELRPVADNWRTFRDEGLALMSAGKVRAATGDNDLGFHTFFKHGWKRFYLKWYDHPIPSAGRFCPRSHELLARIPAVKGAMFAVLPKGGYLGHHRDPFAGSLRYHLGLSTPNDSRCWIEVDGQQRVWRDGEALVFDETFVHRANNRTETDRLVLLCDIERPMAAPLRQLNRWVMRHVMGATGTQNEPGEAIGAINRLYSRVSVLQHAIKSLKARNRRLYNLQKWATIAALLGLLLAPY